MACTITLSPFPASVSIPQFGIEKGRRYYVSDQVFLVDGEPKRVIGYKFIATGDLPGTQRGYSYLRYQTCAAGDDPGPCEPVGACCVEDPETEDITCVLSTLAECQALLGDYKGDGTGCQDEGICGVTGACCYFNNEHEIFDCDITTQQGCDALSGVWQGEDTTCGECLEGLLGACCVETPEWCIITDEDDCFENQNGTGFCPGEVCADCTDCGIPPAACCFEDGTCQNLLEADCIAQGGFYVFDYILCGHPLATCDDIAACCLPDGDCIETTPGLCISFPYFGIPLPEFETCEAADSENACGNLVQACCFGDGLCQDFPASQCTQQGGQPQGFGTECVSTNCNLGGVACCCGPGNHFCFNAPDDDFCIALGCDPQTCPTPPCLCGNPNIECEGIGEVRACCFSENNPPPPGVQGFCINGTPADECVRLGGWPMGEGSTCGIVDCTPWACCTAGFCQEVPVNTCNDIPNSQPFPGQLCPEVSCP